MCQFEFRKQLNQAIQFQGAKRSLNDPSCGHITSKVETAGQLLLSAASSQPSVTIPKVIHAEQSSPDVKADTGRALRRCLKLRQKKKKDHRWLLVGSPLRKVRPLTRRHSGSFNVTL